MQEQSRLPVEDRAGKWWDKSMDLPPGKTCNQCVNFSFCLQFLGAKNVDGAIHCDWSPRRFEERKAVA